MIESVASEWNQTFELLFTKYSIFDIYRDTEPRRQAPHSLNYDFWEELESFIDAQNVKLAKSNRLVPPYITPTDTWS